MKLTIVAKKMKVSEKLKEKIEVKLGKFDKYFQDDVLADIILSVEKKSHIMEVTIRSNGMIFRSQAMGNDMFESLDSVVDTLERQIRKNKTRLEKRLKEGAFTNMEPLAENIEEEKEFKVVKIKQFDFKPMHMEEAILQMNLLGHEFFTFKNADSNEMCVVYRRKDGKYGLIEPK